MKRSRIFWIVAAAGIFLAVLAALGTTAWIGRFLRGEAFRKLIAAKTGEALDARGRLRSFEVDGLLAVCRFNRGHRPAGIHCGKIARRPSAGGFELAGYHRGAWRVDQIHVASFDGTLRPGSNEPRVSGAPPPAVVHGIEAWLPMRFELGELDIARARVRFRGIEGLEIAFLQDSALHVHPDGAGWAIEGSGGLLVLPKVPALTVVNFRSRAQGDVLFLTDSQFQLGESGKISASGEFASDSKLRIEWSQINVTPFLDPAWRSRFTGICAGTASLEWPEGGLAAGKATGNFRLTDGLALNMEVLDRVATFTGAPQFRRMPLQEISGIFEWTKGILQITNLVAESKGLLRLEGNCTIAAGGEVSGTLRVGVTPQTLQWLPGSRERVFTVVQGGYVWTDVEISGSLQDLREDLSSRLAAAMRDETIDRGARALQEFPDAARDGASGMLDALVPLLK